MRETLARAFREGKQAASADRQANRRHPRGPSEKVPAEEPVRCRGAVQGMESVCKFAERVVRKLKQAERPSLQDVNSEHFLSGAGCRPKRKAHVGKLQVCRLAEGRPTTNAKAENSKFAEGVWKRQKTESRRWELRRAMSGTT